MWGEARVNLERAAADTEAPMTAGLARLLARLEEGERGDSAAARRWWQVAGEAEPDAAWLCGHCGAPSAPWSAVCGNCGAFDSLTWRRPTRMAGKALPMFRPEREPAAVVEPETAPPPAVPIAADRAAAPQDDRPGGAPVDAARLVN
jgi:HemY protein